MRTGRDARNDHVGVGVRRAPRCAGVGLCVAVVMGIPAVVTSHRKGGLRPALLRSPPPAVALAACPRRVAVVREPVGTAGAGRDQERQRPGDNASPLQKRLCAAGAHGGQCRLWRTAKAWRERLHRGLPVAVAAAQQ